MPDPSPATLADLAELVTRCRALPLPELLAELRADQARRWRSGQRATAEAYLSAFPELAASPDDALRLVCGEALLRIELGETPRLDEYRARFPQHADALAMRPELRAHLGPSPDAATVTLCDPDGAAPPTPEVPGYEILRELGHGGMGYVWLGRDLRLRRDVAVKVMNEKISKQPHLIRRFVEEAQVASQLQHPAILPVHELGRLPDGRPYFAMKVIRGRTLADLLAARPGPAHDLPRFLHVFEQVCQALAYAHSVGVIHRDLKPSNVMVGAFGEVQVMDWGLAKVLTRPPAAAAPVRPGSAAEAVRAAEAGGKTQAGALLGTLSYMAPEQARGEVDRLDRRCDVFGLGAILCEVLTGRPPFVGVFDEVWADAKMGNLAPALGRLGACGADEELVGLARRCLSPRAEDRPEGAGAVAAALTAYLAGVQERLRRADLERSAAQARAAEERRRRRAQLGLAVAVLVLVAGAAGGGLLAQRQAAERARREAGQAQAAAFAVAKASELREQGRWREAHAVLEQAQRGLGDSGPDDLRRPLNTAAAELALVSRLDAARQLTATLVGNKFDSATAARDYAAAFREAGLGEVGDDEQTVATRIRATGVAGLLVAALDDWAYHAGRAGEAESTPWALGVARLADPSAWGNRFRDPEVWQDRRRLRALADDALRDDGVTLNELSPQLLAALGGLLGAGAEAVPLLRAAHRRYPDDFWLSLELGNALHGAKRVEEAAGYYRVAVALRPDAIAPRINLGVALYDAKDMAGAVAEYRRALEIDPKIAPAYSNLGNALYQKGDVGGAAAAYKRALELDPKLPQGHNGLGNALRAQGNPSGAVAEYNQAIACDPNFALAHHNLGLVLRAGGDQKGAIVAYKKAIDADPNFAEAHYDLGNALYDSEEVGKAIDEYRAAIRLDARDAKAHGALGQALLRQGRFAEAAAATRDSLDLLPRGHPLRQLASQQLLRCEQLAAADKALPAVLGGQAEEPGGAAERLALAQLCLEYRHSYGAAARFYSDAFAADPALAADAQQAHRYNAACCAALAAAGRGEDSGRLPDKARLMLRRQALAWLRADLARLGGIAERDEAARRAARDLLARWWQDSDLAPVRDAEALRQLPEDEREPWRRLWDDVAALARKLEPTAGSEKNRE